MAKGIHPGTNMNDHHSHAQAAGVYIRTAFFLNLVFSLIEVAGGFFTNSLAILSDALHDLGDSFSIGFSWFMESRARPGRGSFSYGFRRLSLLAALVNAVVLLVGSVFILSRAIPRLLAPEPTHPGGMLVLAILGILVNGAAVLRLRNGKSLNEQMVAWHLLEDILGWAAVLAVSVALLITDIHILDPLLSILITCFVLYNVVRNLHKTLAIFLQAAPPDLDLAALDLALGAIEGVLSTHHTHAWSLDGAHNVLTTHLVVPAAASRAEVIRVKKAALKLLEHADLEHTTIEIEYEDEECRMRPG